MRTCEPSPPLKCRRRCLPMYRSHRKQGRETAPPEGIHHRCFSQMRELLRRAATPSREDDQNSPDLLPSHPREQGMPEKSLCCVTPSEVLAASEKVKSRLLHTTAIPQLCFASTLVTKIITVGSSNKDLLGIPV
nr:hypothetical protein Iba_chr09aCG0200 [Ipomoea batatas]GME16987.1 hypothetical protein Iba_scaffold18202CG0130 [Ipomoea batatas]